MSILRILKSQYWPINVAVFLLCFLSLISLLSLDKVLFWRQLIYIAIGFAIVLSLPFINIRPIFNSRVFVYAFYLFSIVLLISTLIFASPIRGTKGWLVMGSVRFQTSELAKVALILVLSQFWAAGHIKVGRILTIIRSFIFFAIPALLILKQPDLGTSLILFGTWVVFLLMSGIRLKHFLIFLAVFLVLAFILSSFVLKPYQKARIFGFMYPNYDVLGVNYSITQAKIAIGSAGFFGKGFLGGTQAHFGFLPESTTDFIFASFVEEWGILGALFWIAVWIWLFFNIAKLSRRLEKNMYSFIALGAAVLFFVQIIINLGSNLGFLPVIGVSLPFFSYGGSNMLTNFILLAIIQAVFIHQTIFRESGFAMVDA